MSGLMANRKQLLICSINDTTVIMAINKLGVHCNVILVPLATFFQTRLTFDLQ